MKRVAIAITISLFAYTNGYSQHQRYNNARPQWPGYYNGYGITPGYRYDPRSGWNTLRLPNGNWMHYRDGYIPLQPGYRGRYYQPYYNNSYLDTMGGLIYGNGW